MAGLQEEVNAMNRRLKDNRHAGDFLTNDCGQGWMPAPAADWMFSGTPFLLTHVLSEPEGARRARLSALTLALSEHGVSLIEFQQQRQHIPSGAIVLHDNGMRVICALAGRSIAEWVSDILNGINLMDEFVDRTNNILANSPPVPLD
jgi:hypothetical protein